MNRTPFPVLGAQRSCDLTGLHHTHANAAIDLLEVEVNHALDRVVRNAAASGITVDPDRGVIVQWDEPPSRVVWVAVYARITSEPRIPAGLSTLSLHDLDC